MSAALYLAPVAAVVTAEALGMAVTAVVAAEAVGMAAAAAVVAAEAVGKEHLLVDRRAVV